MLHKNTNYKNKENKKVRDPKEVEPVTWVFECN